MRSHWKDTELALVLQNLDSYFFTFDSHHVKNSTEIREIHYKGIDLISPKKFEINKLCQQLATDTVLVLPGGKFSSDVPIYSAKLDPNRRCERHSSPLWATLTACLQPLSDTVTIQTSTSVISLTRYISLYFSDGCLVMKKISRRQMFTTDHWMVKGTLTGGLFSLLTTSQRSNSA